MRGASIILALVLTGCQAPYRSSIGEYKSTIGEFKPQGPQAAKAAEGPGPQAADLERRLDRMERVIDRLDLYLRDQDTRRQAIRETNQCLKNCSSQDESVRSECFEACPELPEDVLEI